MKTDPVHQSTLRRFVARSLRYAGLSWLLVLSCLFMGERVLAQTPRSFLIPRPELLVPDQGQVAGGSLGEEPALRGAQAPLKLIVDTDAGVDDAAAIAWLLTQTRYPVEIVGFAAVAGNTTVENVANNLLLLKGKTGQTDIPVTIGSATPLTVTLSSTGKLIHGPDGLWGLGWQNPGFPLNLVGLPGLEEPDVVVDFYCDALDKSTITILALGPLTNLARAIAHCDEDMADYNAIIISGGAKYGGNQIPNAEYNFWQDPDAAAALLQYVAPGPWDFVSSPPTPTIPVSIVSLDIFSQLTFSLKDVEKLANKKSPVGQFLAPALASYICAKNNLPPAPYSACLAALPKGTTAKDVQGSIPDLVATMYVVNRKLGQEQSALVKVMAPVDPALRLVRGQSIIGLNFQERVTMIADDAELSLIADCAFQYPPFTGEQCPLSFEFAVGSILAREPDNVAVVTAINAKRMHDDFIKDLTSKPVAGASAGELQGGEPATGQDAAPLLNQHLYLPLVSDE